MRTRAMMLQLPLLLLLLLLPVLSQAWILQPSSPLARSAQSYHYDCSSSRHRTSNGPSQRTPNRQLLGRLQSSSPSSSISSSTHDLKDTYDHIVIGSGIGGLTVASLLAQSTSSQSSILLLEQHDRLGGCTHAFERRGYSFGIGIHYVGEIEHDCTGLKLQHLLKAIMPLESPLQWKRMPDCFDSVLLGMKEDLRQYDIVAGKQGQVLQEAFPKDRTAIDVYFALVEEAARSARRAVVFKMLPSLLVQWLIRTGWHKYVDKNYSLYANATVHEVIESITDNRELQAVLEYSWGDYGTTPDQAPFVMHALLTKHYWSGAYYPQGGPAEIASHILPVLQQRHVDVRVRTGVSQILISNHKAVGVQLSNGQVIHATKSVISNAGYRSTYQYLLPKPYQRTSPLAQSPTGLALFVGLRGDYELDWKIPAQQLWIYPDDIPMSDMLTRYPSQYQDMQPEQFAPVFVGCPSAKDGDWKYRHPARTTLEIITAAPWEWVSQYAPEMAVSGHSDPGGRPGSHGSEYGQAKVELAQLVWTRARQGLIRAGASSRLPENIEDVDYHEVGSPLTYAHYMWSEKGSFYGLAHDTKRFDPERFYLELRPKTKAIKNLYLTGQDVGSCGMAGAIVGGYLCAAKVTGAWHPFSFLRTVNRHRVISAQPIEQTRRQRWTSRLAMEMEPVGEKVRGLIGTVHRGLLLLIREATESYIENV